MDVFQQGWLPNDRMHNPFYVWHMIHEGEWRRIGHQYPYSVRHLVCFSHNNEVQWFEKARTAKREQAQTVMQALASYSSMPNRAYWVVMEFDCSGPKVLERPVLWYPNQEQVVAQLRQAGRGINA